MMSHELPADARGNWYLDPRADYHLASYGVNERRIRDDFAAYRERHRFS
ncbi:MAG TPA: hypothetical protein VKP66_09200 [Steroidobacteraceae bacterium]|nr:hypothetical protein [Steroidobacteraceae bacterium]